MGQPHPSDPSALPSLLIWLLIMGLCLDTVL